MKSKLYRILLLVPHLLTAEVHWSLKPVQASANDANVDTFIEKRLKEVGLDFSQQASKRALIRRIYLDLTGLLPTPDQVDAFLDDERPDAYRLMVEEVLESPRYGERWARHWLDVVRYADSAGFETNHERPNAYHYRDYVIRAFNEDKPYDQFVFEQIAGDTVDAHAATGFLVAGPSDRVKGKDPLLNKQQRANELADMVGVTSSAFLGLTVACARCHDHKFDPISQEDFYSMQAVLEGVRHGERSIPLSTEVQRKIKHLTEEKAQLKKELRRFIQNPSSQFLLIDEEDEGRVEFLQKIAGKGTNPDGTQRGFRNDPGDEGRSANISGGTYTWWKDKQSLDLAAYRPGLKGSFRIWLSWGNGWKTHTKDALYQIDTDGDPITEDDRKTIATVNQQLFADGSGKVVSKPLWSGFHDAGVYDLSPEAAILLRGGKTGTAVTADVIILQADDGNQTATRPPTLRPPVNFARNVETLTPTAVRHVRFTVETTNNGSEPCLDELELWTAGNDSRNVAGDAKLMSSGDYLGNPKHKLIHLNDGKYGNEHSWISNTMGKGWVQLELPEPVKIERIEWGRDRNQRYKDRLPTKYRIEGALDPGQWSMLADSSQRLPFDTKYTAPKRTYDFAAHSEAEAAQGKAKLARTKEIEKTIATLSSSAKVYAGNFKQPAPTRVLFRGNPLAPRDIVAPDGLSAIRDKLKSFDLQPDAPERDRRIAFAKWIIHKDNPLTARVIVNRIWHYHFGRGIVATPSDFGDMGFRPTHPKLLDWLAQELVENQWSLKHIHRIILNSKTYQQSSKPRKDGIAKDAGSELLWRFPPRRLEAEAIRDNALLLAGVLDETMYGPGFLLFVPNSNYARNWIPKDTFGPTDYRRMVYTQRIRMEQDAIFGAFDCPDGGQAAPNRSRSTTPIQALNLLNSDFIADIATKFAQRLKKEAGPDTKQQIYQAYRSTFGRSPAIDEITDALVYLEAYGLAALCRVFLNANEFLFMQ